MGPIAGFRVFYLRLRVFALLTSCDRALLLEILALTLFASVSVRLAGLPRTQRWLALWACRRRRRTISVSGPLFVGRAARLQRMVRRRLETTCLVRSLALWALLLKHGLKAHLRIGVRKKEGVFEGHAWVEHEFVPVNEKADIALDYQPHTESIRFDSRA